MTALIRSSIASLLVVALCAVSWAPARALAQAAPPSAPAVTVPTQPPPPSATPDPAAQNPLPQTQPELVQPLAPPTADQAPVTPPTEAPPPAQEEPPLPAATAVPYEDTVPAPTAEPAVPESTAPSKIPSYVLWGASGASLIVGAIFGISALAAKNDYDDSPSYSRADSVERRALIADAALGLGVVLAVTGTVFFFTSHAQQTEGSAKATTGQLAKSDSLKLQLVPLVGPRGGGAAASLRF